MDTCHTMPSPPPPRTFHPSWCSCFPFHATVGGCAGFHHPTAYHTYRYLLFLPLLCRSLSIGVITTGLRFAACAHALRYRTYTALYAHGSGCCRGRAGSHTTIASLLARQQRLPVPLPAPAYLPCRRLRRLLCIAVAVNHRVPSTIPLPAGSDDTTTPACTGCRTYPPTPRATPITSLPTCQHTGQLPYTWRLGDHLPHCGHGCRCLPQWTTLPQPVWWEVACLPHCAAHAGAVEVPAYTAPVPPGGSRWSCPLPHPAQ